MADQGRAKKAVILELIKNIEQFNAVVRKEIGDIQKDATKLSACWDDPQYKDFMNYTTEITKGLNRDVELLDGLAKNLQIKADIM